MEAKKMMPTFNVMKPGQSEDYPLIRLLSVRKQAANWNAMYGAMTGHRMRCEIDHTSGVVRVTKEPLAPAAGERGTR